MNSFFLRFALSALFLGFLTGCETVGYYVQAINGHARLMDSAEPIEQRLADPALDGGMRERLRTVLAVRDFASEVLALPDNGSYRAYADIGSGKAVVWSLVATPEFSVDALEWCYPVVGCAVYRAYFAENDAREQSQRLLAEGRDVVVSPVPAYSTLGWFDDPLPSTVIRWPETRLAGLVFHELAHQRLYLPGDSAFNESFATAVELAGVERWLERRGDAVALETWRRARQREEAFIGLLLRTRAQLDALYARALSPERLRSGKQRAFAALRADYARLVSSWTEGERFDAWFALPVNNARLALLGTYEQWVPAFLRLLDSVNGDFATFYRAAQRLSALPRGERERRLAQLSGAGTRMVDVGLE